MSVAAMTLDDQRPLMNSFDVMKKEFVHVTNISDVVAGGAAMGAPNSGPASPTPSTPDEQQLHQQQHHHHHHHVGHHHHHHHHHQHQPHQQNQMQQSATTVQSQQQQQQQPQLPYDAAGAVAVAEQRQRLLEEEIEALKLERSRLTQQCADAQRREKILMRRLANKEQEFQDYVSQIAEYKAAQAPGPAALRSALLDPAINLLFEKLKKELKATKAKLEETQNELSAWKFTPDSNTGKRLMAKCRLLYQENEELGKMTSNGRLAKLETELAMQKSFSEEVKKSQSELDDFLQELDEDVEGMQSTILFLQQELKTTRDRIQVLEKENLHLKNTCASHEKITADVDVAQQSQQNLAMNGCISTQESVSAIQSGTNVAPSGESADKNGNHVFKKLETIDENMCPPTNPNILSTPPTPTRSEFLNGMEFIQQTGTASVALDGGSENCGSSTAAITITRTPSVSRKRNYDESDIITENPAVSVSVTQLPVAAPRTLPPKKSKLRVTPSRRASLQSVDVAENDNTAAVVTAAVGFVTNNIQQDLAAVSSTENPCFADNALAGVASEEATAAAATTQFEETNNSCNISGGGAFAVASQRIMTRRMSLRNQPNETA